MDATRVLGYVRVSTDQQVEDGYGLDAQRTKIVDECARRGWELIEIVGEDGGQSAKSLDRVGLQSVLTRMDVHEADVLVVSKMDRLSRSLIQGAQVIERAKIEGWQLVALDLNVDMTTPAGELIVNIILAASQYERRLIGVRTREGLAAARAQGVVFGRPSGLAVETVDRITHEHRDGRSLRRIADSLNTDQIPASRGGVWHPSSVRAVLARV